MERDFDKQALWNADCGASLKWKNRTRRVPAAEKRTLPNPARPERVAPA
jgi:hypothetical protein